MPKNNLVTILITSNQQILKVAKSLLDDANIDYVVNGDGFNGSNKNDHLGDTIEIQVLNEKAIKAKTLLADLQELDFDEKGK